mgnify:FL=1
MRKILEEFYFGNLRPSERRVTPSSELRQAVSSVSRCEQQLMEQLNESEQAILKDMVSAQQDIDSITGCESFVLDFRPGVRMMAECMDQDDGDTLEMTRPN